MAKPRSDKLSTSTNRGSSEIVASFGWFHFAFANLVEIFPSNESDAILKQFGGKVVIAVENAIDRCLALGRHSLIASQD